MKYFFHKKSSTILSVTVVILVVLVFAFSSSIRQAEADWYSTGGTWTYRKTITIDNAQVPSDQTNFPVLVDITDSGLAANARTDGFDIFFTSSDGTTKLAHEREVYTTATGRLTAWVKVTSLSTSVDTVIYMYYGNASSGDMQDVAPVDTDVWDSDYMAVWHMSSSVTTVNDSTSNARTGTKRATGEPAAISGGKIYDAQDYDGNANSGGNDYINVGTTDILTGRETNWTICAWVQAQGSKDNGWAGTIYSRITTEGTPSGAFQFAAVDPTGAPGTGGADSDFIDVYTNSGSDNTAWADSGPGTGAWVYYCAARTAAGTVSFYKNGASDGSDAYTAPSVAASQVQTLGTSWQSGSNDQVWHGYLDEIRLSDIARSADWITTEYNNQNATSTFYQIGTSETEPVVSSSVPHVTVRGEGGTSPSVNIRGSGATGQVEFR